MVKRKRVKAGTSKVESAKRKALFVEAYCENGGNATQAAVTAGYKPGSAAEKAGYRLSNDVRIAGVLKERRAQEIAVAEAKTGLTIEGTLRELGRIVYADPRKFFNTDGNLKPVQDLDDDCAAALASVEVTEEFSGRGESREMTGYLKKVKFWDKNSAIEKAMKHFGMFEKDNAQKPPVTLPPIFNIIGVAGRK